MRILIHASSSDSRFKETFEFFLPDMPCRLNQGDLIRLGDLITEDGLTDYQLDMLYSLAFSVDFVCWGKDTEGVYQHAYCTGE